VLYGWGKAPWSTDINHPQGAGFDYMGSPRASGGTSFIDHAFFCNFLLTKGLTQFNMAVDKTRNGRGGARETKDNPQLGENGKEKLVTTFLN
jgi:hypothetical protein